MAILSKGTNFSTGDQVTATGLDNLVDAATFDTPADDVTIEVNGSGLLQNKDGGLAPAKLSTGAPSWDSSSNVTVGGALTVTGGQIVFPATAVPSSNVNTLDDYEEGTWNPSLGGNTTYLQRSGIYTKIGNVVFFEGRLQVDTLGTGSTYQITGIPFSPNKGAITVNTWLSTASSFVYLAGSFSGANIILNGATAAASSLSATPNVFGDGTYVSVGGFYIIT